MKMLLPVLLMLATGKTILPGEVKVKTLPPESREVLDYLPRNIVIAHRGTTYWAPEETEAAMRWAVISEPITWNWIYNERKMGY